jgi:mannose-1-phosphate guanylyltransferase
MHPEAQASPCALILAGGDGTRLRPLTRQISGDERPKQFCRVLSGQTLLEQTLQRSAWLVPPERTLVVVVRAHEPFYAPLLRDHPQECLVVQPQNRGTAPAILYSLLRLSALGPPAPVAILPSDHFVSDDNAFMEHVGEAFDAVMARPDRVVLLGVVPTTAEADYGWIEPGEAIGAPGALPLYRVEHFWEKPSPSQAHRLWAGGCLWNSFVMVAYPAAFLDLIRRGLPALFDAFTPVQSRLTTSWEDDNLRRLYARLPSTDFSAHALTTRQANLTVLPVRDVGWNDLGEPGRVTATLVQISLLSESTGPTAQTETEGRR